MGNVKYAINTAPLGQLDSLHYFSLKDQVGFDLVFSWNFRGYVATWRVNGNKLYLETLKTGSDKADFRDVLKDLKIVAVTFSRPGSAGPSFVAQAPSFVHRGMDGTI